MNPAPTAPFRCLRLGLAGRRRIEDRESLDAGRGRDEWRPYGAVSVTIAGATRAPRDIVGAPFMAPSTCGRIARVRGAAPTPALAAGPRPDPRPGAIPPAGLRTQP